MQSSKTITYLTAAGAFALGMDAYITTGLLPMIETDFSVSTAAAAQLVTAFTLAYGLGAPVLVALTPAHRQRSALLLALLAFAAANAASTLTNHFGVLMLTRAIAGIGAGVYLAMGISASAAFADKNWRGKSTAFIMGGMASGTVLGVPGGLLAAERFGWKAALLAVAALGTATFVGLLLRLPVLPRSCPGPAEETRRASFRSKLSLLRDRHVLTILMVSLLAAVSSLGMYTFVAPFMTAPENGSVHSVVPFLWAWGIGGVLGSFFIGPLVDRIKGPLVALGIMTALSLALFSLPAAAAITPWAALAPLALWGAVGWALQVPQSHELLKARQTQDDGVLAVALNGSALYMGSAIGAAAGGGLLLTGLPLWALPAGAGSVAALGALLQLVHFARLQRQTCTSEAFGAKTRNRCPTP